MVWGDNTYGQTSVPAGLSNVVAIAAGDFHTFALRTDGSIVGWGDNSFGQTDTPSNLTNAVGVAAGYYHGLALVPVIPRLRYTLAPNGLVIEWSGPGLLQSASTVTGPFADIPGLWRSYTNSDLSAPGKFFRLRR